MKAVLWTTILASFSLSLADPSIEYTCSTVIRGNTCILDGVHYNRSGASTASITFPQNFTHVNFTPGGSVVTVFDPQLYRELGQPEAVQLAYAQLEQLEIPRKLLLAGFIGNRLTRFTLEEDGEPSEYPNLRYLDLSRNRISDVSPAGSMVRLHTLYLYDNRIAELGPEAFAKLFMLKYLNLERNQIEQLTGEMLPKNLIVLKIGDNRIKSLDLNAFYQPSIEQLFIGNNRLESLDASALVTAMPALQEVHMAANRFDVNTASEVKEVLRTHNVTCHSEN